MGNCCNICADDPVPESDLPKVEESYEYFCDTQINYAIIGVKQQVEEKYQKLAEQKCKEHGLSSKYGFHSSIFVYCSKESKTGYCLEFGELYKNKDKSYYPDYKRFYYHKEKDSAGGVRYNRMSVEDYISHKCKEGCVHLKTNQMLAKEYMERAEKDIIFDVKNFHQYSNNCHKFVLESVIALSAKIDSSENNKCINNFADEILQKIK